MALGASKRSACDSRHPSRQERHHNGIMLNLARVAGETAPLLFTSFSNRYWSPGWDQADGRSARDDLYLRDFALCGLASNKHGPRASFFSCSFLRLILRPAPSWQRKDRQDESNAHTDTSVHARG